MLGVEDDEDAPRNPKAPPPPLGELTEPLPKGDAGVPTLNPREESGDPVGFCEKGLALRIPPREKAGDEPAKLPPLPNPDPVVLSMGTWGGGTVFLPTGGTPALLGVTAKGLPEELLAKGLALLTPLPPTVDFKKEEVLPVLLALLEKGLPKGPEEPDPMVEENTFFTPVPWVLLVAGFENGFAAEVSFGAPCASDTGEGEKDGFAAEKGLAASPLLGKPDDVVGGRSSPLPSAGVPWRPPSPRAPTASERDLVAAAVRAAKEPKGDGFAGSLLSEAGFLKETIACAESSLEVVGVSEVVPPNLKGPEAAAADWGLGNPKGEGLLAEDPVTAVEKAPLVADDTEPERSLVNVASS